MKTSLAKLSLSTQVRTVIDKVGQGKNRRAIRRTLLIDRETGLLQELSTAFVLRELGQKATNTHGTVLYDLAFYLEWAKLKAGRSKTWICPEDRLRAGRPALSAREIGDLGTWCQSTARDLVRARRREAGNVRMLASANGVETSTTNRRLQNISRYFLWLIKEMIGGTLCLEDRDIAKSVYFEEALKSAFASQMNADKKAAPFASLTKTATKAFRQGLASLTLFPNTPCGRRDRMIGQILLDNGLRSGELLKLQCGDVSDNHVRGDGKTAGVLKVIRRPNDHADTRKREPAVKTLPGPIAISKRLASDIIKYVIGDRRSALERSTSPQETSYLLVCHSGPRTGQPMSQRNLNRIVAKLKTVLAIAEPLSPHTLRHTHFTELADYCAESGKDEKTTQELLRVRGHWAPKSESPKRYTSRFTAKLEADLVEERDRLLESHN